MFCVWYSYLENEDNDILFHGVICEDYMSKVIKHLEWCLTTSKHVCGYEIRLYYYMPGHLPLELVQGHLGSMFLP